MTGAFKNKTQVCLVPGCGEVGTIAKGLCRHHYDHRYDHYKKTGVVLTGQQMADNPIKRCPNNPGSKVGRSTGGAGEPLPHPDDEVPIKLNLDDPEVRKHTMVAMSNVDKALPSVIGSPQDMPQVSAKSDIKPQEEKIPTPPVEPIVKSSRRREVDIKREILIARLDWLQSQIAITIRELTSKD